MLSQADPNKCIINGNHSNSKEDLNSNGRQLIVRPLMAT